MEIRYGKQYSQALGREMEYKIYGHGGKPFLIIPCQAGRFYEFEDRKMTDYYAPYIESGKVQLFTIDTIDSETLVASGDPRARIELHERWIRYITEEAVPLFGKINGTGQRFGVEGLSLGALHAATLTFRFPDLFDMLLGISGLYSNEFYFGSYHDDLTYANSPEQFLPNMPADHPYMEKYRRDKIILCVGQGAWENVTAPSTMKMDRIFREKGIPAWVDVWGFDVKHDWDWWYRQTAYLLPSLFKDL